MIVCPGCGMSTWIDGEGCALPGCENYRVLVSERWWWEKYAFPSFVVFCGAFGVACVIAFVASIVWAIRL